MLTLNNGVAVFDNAYGGLINVRGEGGRLVTNGDDPLTIGASISIDIGALWFNLAADVLLKANIYSYGPAGSIQMYRDDDSRAMILRKSNAAQVFHLGGTMVIQDTADVTCELPIRIDRNGVLLLIEGSDTYATLNVTSQGNATTSNYSVYMERGYLVVTPQTGIGTTTWDSRKRLKAANKVFVGQQAQVNWRTKDFGTEARFDVRGYAVIFPGCLWVNDGTVDLTSGGILQGWIASRGASRLVVFTGDLLLDGTAVLNYGLNVAAPGKGTRYLIAQASTGSISGDFGTKLLPAGVFDTLIVSNAYYLKATGTVQPTPAPL